MEVSALKLTCFGVFFFSYGPRVPMLAFVQDICHYYQTEIKAKLLRVEAKR